MTLSVATATKSILYISVCLVVLSFILKAALSFLLSIIKNISLMVHMFLLTLNYPVNLLNFMNIMFPLVMFDIIPTTEIFEIMFHFKEVPDHSLSDQFDTLGYSSIFSVNNLGSIYFVIQFGPVFLLCLWLVSRYKPFYKYKKL